VQFGLHTTFLLIQKNNLKWYFVLSFPKLHVYLCICICQLLTCTKRIWNLLFQEVRKMNVIDKQRNTVTLSVISHDLRYLFLQNGLPHFFCLFAKISIGPININRPIIAPVVFSVCSKCKARDHLVWITCTTNLHPSLTILNHVNWLNTMVAALFFQLSLNYYWVVFLTKLPNWQNIWPLCFSYKCLWFHFFWSFLFNKLFTKGSVTLFKKLSFLVSFCNHFTKVFFFCS